MENIMKRVKFLEESSLLLKGVSEIIETEAKEEKEGFPSMLLGTLAESVLKNLEIIYLIKYRIGHM